MTETYLELSDKKKKRKKNSWRQGKIEALQRADAVEILSGIIS